MLLILGGEQKEREPLGAAERRLNLGTCSRRYIRGQNELRSNRLRMSIGLSLGG